LHFLGEPRALRGFEVHELAGRSQQSDPVHAVRFEKLGKLAGRTVIDRYAGCLSGGDGGGEHSVYTMSAHGGDVTTISRRSLFKGAAAAGTAFQIIRPELVRGAGKEMLKAGLIGCGGRGQQAVMDMMNGTENTQIVAMGDVFEDRLEGALGWLRRHRDFEKFKDRIKVEPERHFVGFDAYKKVLASDIDI